MPLTHSSFPNADLQRVRFSDEVQQLSIRYRFCRCLTQALMCSLWQVRVFNRRFEPADGGVLYLSNHQSYLDPPLISFALQRPMNFMARHTLFRFALFRKLIEAFHAFPVKVGTADIGALKEAMRRLKAGRQLVVFPEGTRTYDGRIGPLLPGAALLAQRAAKWTVPVLIDGAVDCWPRTQLLPTPGNIVVQYGRPIPQTEARRRDADSFMNMVRNRLIEMQSDVRRRMGRPAFDYTEQ